MIISKVLIVLLIKYYQLSNGYYSISGPSFGRVELYILTRPTPHRDNSEVKIRHAAFRISACNHNMHISRSSLFNSPVLFFGLAVIDIDKRNSKTLLRCKLLTLSSIICIHLRQHKWEWFALSVLFCLVCVMWRLWKPDNNWVVNNNGD